MSAAEDYFKKKYGGDQTGSEEKRQSADDYFSEKYGRKNQDSVGRTEIGSADFYTQNRDYLTGFNDWSKGVGSYLDKWDQGYKSLYDGYHTAKEAEDFGNGIEAERQGYLSKAQEYLDFFNKNKKYFKDDSQTKYLSGLIDALNQQESYLNETKDYLGQYLDEYDYASAQRMSGMETDRTLKDIQKDISEGYDWRTDDNYYNRILEEFNALYQKYSAQDDFSFVTGYDLENRQKTKDYDRIYASHPQAVNPDSENVQPFYDEGGIMELNDLARELYETGEFDSREQARDALVAMYNYEWVKGRENAGNEFVAATGASDLTNDVFNSSELYKGVGRQNYMGELYSEQEAAAKNLTSGIAKELKDAGWERDPDVKDDYYKHWEEANDEERDVLRYLASTGQTDKLQDYQDQMERVWTKREADARKKAVSEWTSKNWFNSALGSIGTVGLKFLKPISFMGQLIQGITEGSVDPNASYNLPSDVSTTIRSTVASNIAKDTGSQLLGNTYQLGMSMVDSVADMLVTKGLSSAGMSFKAAENLTLGMMSAGVAADTFLEKKEKGYSDNDARAYGIVAGLAEFVTERVSLEQILDPNFLKDSKIKYLLKSSAAEGSEEIASNVINDVFDIVFMHDKSEWQQSIRDYMREGLDYSESFARAIADKSLEYAESGIGGFVSGGVMAGGRLGLNYVSNYQKGADLLREDYGTKYSDLINEGLLYDEGTGANRIANELQNMDPNKRSRVKTGELMSAIEYENAQEAEGMNLLRQAAEELTEKGRIKRSTAKELTENPYAVEELDLTRTNNPDLNKAVKKYSDNEKSIAASEMREELVKSAGFKKENVGKGIKAYNPDPFREAAYQPRSTRPSEEQKNIEAFIRYKTAENQYVSRKKSEQLAKESTPDAWLSAAKNDLNENQTEEVNTAVELAESHAKEYSDSESGNYMPVFKNLLANRISDENGINVNLGQYTEEYNLFYAAGRENADVSAFPNEGWVLNSNERLMAFKAGQQDANIKAKGDNQNEQGELPVRGIGDRNDGEDTAVGTRGVAEEGRRTEAIRGSGEAEGGYADTEIRDLPKTGKEVSAVNFKIKDGTDERKVRLYTGVLTTAMKNAKEIAKKHGLKVVFFYGDNLSIEGSSVRGVIKGDGTVYVRVDHELFTAEDLMKHESFHAIINSESRSNSRKKAIDRMWDTLRSAVGGNDKSGNTAKLLEHYAKVYHKDLSSEEDVYYLKEEILADMYAGMNVFKGFRYNGWVDNIVDLAQRFRDIVNDDQDIKRAANRQRGEPGEEKHSTQILPDGTKYVKLDGNLFMRPDGTEMTPRQAFRALVGTKITFDDGETIVIRNGIPNVQMYHELFTRFPAVKNILNMKLLNDEINRNIIEVFQESRVITRDVDDRNGEHKESDIVSFDTRTVSIADDSMAFDLDVTIAKLKSGEKIAYTKRFVKANEELNNKIAKANIGSNPTVPSQDDNTSSIKKSQEITERQSSEFSYTEAVNNGDMAAAQRLVDEVANEAFKESKVRDKDGNLLRMYHGTNAQFNAFEREKIGSTGRFEGSGFNFTPYEGRASSYGKNVLGGYLDIENPLSAERKTISVSKLAQIIREADPTGDNIIANYAEDTSDYGSERFIKRESLTTAKSIWDWAENDVDIYSEISSADPDAETLISVFEKLGYDGLIHYDDNGEIKTAVAFSSNQFKKADPVTYDNNGEVIPLSERFNTESNDIRYSRELKSEEKRRTGAKLTEREFYSLYSAHKLDLRKHGNVEDQIANIKEEGFKGDGGFGSNLMPSRQIVRYPTIDKYNLFKEWEEEGKVRKGYADQYKAEMGDEYGKPVPDNISVAKYAPRKGEWILLVPRSGAEINKNYDRVKPGYKPLFDYEIVQADYDYQPYYEMYSKAYDAANENNEQTRFSREFDKDVLKKLDEEKTVTVYRAMQVIDGKLYPPMAAKVRDENGKNQLVEPTVLGEWYRADERPDLIRNGKFKLDKANGSAIEAAYNPYWHTSMSMLNDQFSSAYNRPNLVTVECEVPESELRSGYKAEFAKDSVGEMQWHSGPVSSKLAKLGNPRKVILSRWVKVNRIVPDAEAAGVIAKMLKGTGISIPDNTVTPSLKDELKKLGVSVKNTGINAIREDLNKNGVELAGDFATKFSADTWYETDKKKLLQALKKAGFEGEVSKRWIDDVNGIAQMIVSDRIRWDYKSTTDEVHNSDGSIPKKRKVSSFVSNVEYGGSFDSSTICAKRRLYTGTIEEIQFKLPNTVLTENDYLRIKEIMEEEGLEVQCAFCYVEGSRLKLGEYTGEFLKQYEKTNPMWMPSQADLTTASGLENVRMNHNEAYEAYLYFMNNNGRLDRDNQKALFASQQKPKLYMMSTAYNGEIRTMFLNDNKVDENSVKEKNLAGGIRFNSFSDQEIFHLIDTMQVIMDMASVGLAGQGYTKQAIFAKAFGGTGMKINLSTVAKGVDENGRIIFENTEGMNINEALKIRNGDYATDEKMRQMFRDNVGIEVCVFNDEQLLAALADDRIDFIIPFHRSQYSRKHYDKTGLTKKINGIIKDYTNQQNEKWLNPKDHTHEYQGRTVLTKCQNYMPNEYWDEKLSGKENAEKYLEMCFRDGKRPKFYKLLQKNSDGSYSLKDDGSTDGYWKLLSDYKMYESDANGAITSKQTPQMPIKPNFNMDAIRSSMESYKGGHRYADGSMKFESNEKVVSKFLEEYKKNHEGEKHSQDFSPFAGEPSTLTEAREMLKKIEKEKEKYRKEAEYYKGQMQTTVTHLDPKSAERWAGKIAKAYGPNIDKEKVAESFKEAGRIYIDENGKTGTVEMERKIRDALYPAVEEIVHHAMVQDDEHAAEYESLRKTLKSGIYISEQDKADITDYNEFRKQNLGNIKLTNDPSKGKPIDSLWSELQGEFGMEMFPEEITSPSEKLKRAVEVLKDLRGMYVNMFQDYEMAEAGQWVEDNLMTDLYNGMIRGTEPTYADKMEARLSEERQKTADRIKKAVEENQKKNDRVIEELKREYKENTKSMVRAQRIQDMSERERISQNEKLRRIIKRLRNRKLSAVNRARIDEIVGDLDTMFIRMTGERLTELQALDDYLRDNPEIIVPDRIQREVSSIRKKHIGDLTQEEVAKLTEALLSIETEIANQNKQIDAEDKRETFRQAAEAMNDIQKARGTHPGFLRELHSVFVMNTLSPERFVRTITGYKENDPLAKSFYDLTKGEAKMQDHNRLASKMFDKWTEDTKLMRKWQGKHAEEITVNGQGRNGSYIDVTITPAMRVSLYLHSLNDDNMRHIQYGGINIPDMKLYKAGKYADAVSQGLNVRFTRADIRKIAAGMTAEERAFANAVKEYFEGMSKDAINEVSEKLVGYDIAGEENYFPIYTNQNFVKTNFDGMKFDGTIEGMGFLKERINSVAPIYLQDVTKVMKRSIESTARYVGLAIPVRNVNKLLGVTSGEFIEQGRYQGEITTYAPTDSILASIDSKYGKPGIEYIRQLMRNLQSGSKEMGNVEQFLRMIRSHYAGAVLTLNAGVALKQAASYPTAAAVLGTKPLLRAMKYLVKNDVDMELVAKYTPTLWYRSRGFSTQEIGDITSSGVKLPKQLNWIQWVDIKTTAALWKASEFYVQENMPQFKIGEDAYYEQVARIYNRVIWDTQPNYTTMQRPGNLRSDSFLEQTLMMFKTQPFQNFNVIYDAVGNYRAKRSEYFAAKKDGEGVAEAEKRYQEAGKNVRRAIGSQVISTVVFAAMTAVWALLRGKKDKYKDKEGNENVLTWVAGIGKDALGGAAGMIPFGSDFWDVVSSVIFKDRYYGYSSVSESAVKDILDTLQSTASAITEGKMTAAKWKKLVKNTAEAFGVPAKNVTNLFNMILHWFGAEEIF